MTWKPLPPESKAAEVWLAFIDDPDTKYFLLEGAVRSTKTYGSILAACDYVENVCPKGQIAMMGNTLPTLLRNVIQPMQDLLSPGQIQLNRGTSTLTLFGRKISLIGAPNVIALKKLQGAGFVFVYCDEAETYPYEVWQMLGTRTDAEHMKIMATFNPGPPAHYLKKEYLDRLTEVNGRHWHFTLDDNPFMSEKKKAELKAQYTGMWYKRYILGLWVSADGAIYPNYEDAVISDPPACDLHVVGCDYGNTNAFVYLLLGKKGTTWYVLREWYHEKEALVNSQYAAQLGRFLGGVVPRYVDVDWEPAFIEELRSQYPNLDVKYAIKEVLPGIQKVAQMMYSGALKISDQCPKLIEELAGYVWDTKAQEKGEDAPVKVNDHGCDALRYACMRIRHTYG